MACESYNVRNIIIRQYLGVVVTVCCQTVDIKSIKSPQQILCVTDLFSRERRNYMIMAIYCFLYHWLCFALVQILTIALNWYSSSIPCKRDLCAPLWWGTLLSEEAFFILWCSDFYGWEIIAFLRPDTVPGDIADEITAVCLLIFWHILEFFLIELQVIVDLHSVWCGWVVF